MCLATPCKIVDIEGKTAVVQSKNHTHTVDLSLIKSPQIGDYILVHADMAINKVPQEEAEKILSMVEKI